LTTRAVFVFLDKTIARNLKNYWSIDAVLPDFVDIFIILFAESKTRLAVALLDMFTQFGSQQIRNSAVSLLVIIIIIIIITFFRPWYFIPKV